MNRLQSEKRIAVMEADAMVKKMNQDVTETANHKRTVYAMANELRQLVDTANANIIAIKTDEITGFSREEAFYAPLIETSIDS